jgi:hypothetical protein
MSAQLKPEATMNKTMSHSRQEETPEAKARWFQSLSLVERMEMLCIFTDLILETNPKVLDLKDAKPSEGRIRVLAKVPS